MNLITERPDDGVIVKRASGEVIASFLKNTGENRWELIWNGELGREDIMGALEQVLPVFQADPLPGMLVDERELITDVSSLREWLSENIMPGAYAKGLRKIAILKSKDIDTQMMSMLTLQEANMSFFPNVVHFDKASDATAWLASD